MSINIAALCDIGNTSLVASASKGKKVTLLAGFWKYVDLLSSIFVLRGDAKEWAPC